MLEKQIKVSTQGRLTIPKQIRDALGIRDGQPITVRTSSDRRELIVEILPTMLDYER
jgi:AbrB family looped-hinge helix DNA binding protein